MLEIKDIVQLGVGIAGWTLAAYQFWRHELTRRPLVLLEVYPPERRVIPARLRVRNRSPRDVYVQGVRLLRPKNAVFLLAQERARRSEFFIPPVARMREFQLSWRLNAFSSGDFPSKSVVFSIELPEGSTATSIEIAVDISPSRDATRSSRFTARQRIARVNSSTAP
jgi:hypothetical protein